MRTARPPALIPLLLLLGTIHAACSEYSPVRETSSGRIQGYVHHLSGGRQVERYLGVPYATPPVGSRRFEFPVPAEKWTDVRNATSLSPACVQTKFPDDAYIKEHAPEFDGTENEDCLYLNIYVPVRQEPTPVLLPVLVHIHGGSNEAGMGAMLNGDALASYGQIIVVNLNYRLGAFGFLHVPQVGIPGNLGLRDQILALTWIRDNIHHFGGEPSQVTIQGHSAGGVDVGLLVLSPAATGLFRYAILQSGAPTAYWAIQADSDPHDETKGPLSYLNSLGCPLEDRETTINCLKSISATRISETLFKHELGEFHFSPKVDDLIVPDNPQTLLKTLAQERRGTWNCQSIMIGVVKDEGSYSVKLMKEQAETTLHLPLPPEEISDAMLKSLPRNISDLIRQGGNLTEIIAHLAEPPERMFYKMCKSLPLNILDRYGKGGHLTELAHFMYKPWADPENATAYYVALAHMFGDSTFTAPSVETAEYISNSARSHVYVYSFEHRSKLSSHPEWMGVPHGDDLFYLFGSPIVGHSKRNYTDLDRSVSLALIDLWSHFVKYGRPSLTQKKSSFQTFGDQQNYIAITSNETDVVIEEKQRMRARYMAFWNRVMATEHNSDQEEDNTCDQHKTITWILTAALCVVSFVSLIVIVYLLRKMRSHRVVLKQAPNVI